MYSFLRASVVALSFAYSELRKVRAAEVSVLLC